MKETDRKIAIFMGEPLVFMHDDCGYMSKKPLHYDYLDWNKLMPVVEKIERLAGVTVIIKKSRCRILVGKKVFSCHTIVKLNSMYRVVVEFIEWLNTTKQQEQKPDPGYPASNPTGHFL